MPNCRKCLEPKEEGEMSKQSDGRDCKECVAAYQREYYRKKNAGAGKKTPLTEDQREEQRLFSMANSLWRTQ